MEASNVVPWSSSSLSSSFSSSLQAAEEAKAKAEAEKKRKIVESLEKARAKSKVPPITKATGKWWWW